MRHITNLISISFLGCLATLLVSNCGSNSSSSTSANSAAKTAIANSLSSKLTGAGLSSDQASALSSAASNATVSSVISVRRGVRGAIADTAQEGIVNVAGNVVEAILEACPAAGVSTADYPKVAEAAIESVYASLDNNDVGGGASIPEDQMNLLNKRVFLEVAENLKDLGVSPLVIQSNLSTWTQGALDEMYTGFGHIPPMFQYDDFLDLIAPDVLSAGGVPTDLAPEAMGAFLTGFSTGIAAYYTGDDIITKLGEATQGFTSSADNFGLPAASLKDWAAMAGTYTDAGLAVKGLDYNTYQDHLTTYVNAGFVACGDYSTSDISTANTYYIANDFNYTNNYQPPSFTMTMPTVTPSTVSTGPMVNGNCWKEYNASTVKCYLYVSGPNGLITTGSAIISVKTKAGVAVTSHTFTSLGSNNEVTLSASLFSAGEYTTSVTYTDADNKQTKGSYEGLFTY